MYLIVLLANAIFPEDWKSARVIPLFKLEPLRGTYRDPVGHGIA